MKKWLVGLLTASLFAASAWAASVTYTVTSKAAVTASGDVLEGSSADYTADGTQVCQISKDKSAKLTLKGFNGATITGLTLSMKSNKSAGAGTLKVTVGNTTVIDNMSAPFNSTNYWYSDYTTNYVDITPEWPATVVNGDVVILIGGVVNSLYCQSYTIDYTFGEPEFAVSLDPADDFEVEQGEEGRTITATVTGAQGEVIYAWSVNGTPIELAGNVYSIDSTEVSGPFEVVCEVMDETDEIVSDSVTYSVVAPATKYTVGCAVGIPNGSVSVDKVQAAEGETVTVTATPADGYRLVAIVVDDGAVAVSGNTFVMPAHDVLVSAEFELKPVVAGFSKITSLDQLTPGEYVITGAASGAEYAMKASIAGTSTKYIERRDDAVTIEDDVVTDAEAAIIWTLAQGADGWTIYNEAIGYVGYVASGNSSGAEAEASTNSSWTIAASDGLFLLTNVGNSGRYLLYNASSPRFACYDKTTSGKQLALYKGSSMPGALSVNFDQENPLTLEEGTAGSVTAIARGGEGPYAYVWESETEELNGTDATLAIPATLAVGTYTATVTVTDNAGIEVSKPFGIVVSAPATKYTVTVADGILNGTVELKVDGTIVDSPAELAEGTLVTVVATADPHYTLDKILLNDEELAANPFTVTCDAWVTAVFVESQEVSYTKIGSADELVPGDYVITGAKAEGEEYAMKAEISTTSTAYILRDENALAPVDGVISTGDDSIVWTLAEGEDGWTIYNEAVGYIGYVKSGNSAGAEAAPSTKSSWSITSDEGVFSVDNVATPARHLWYNNSSPRFACYTNPTLTSTYRSLNFYKAETGPKITFTGETTVQLPDGAFELQFSLKNYEGEFEWVLDSREGGSIDQNGLYTWAPTEAGDVTIKVIARNGELDLDSVEVPLTVEAAPVEPELVIGGDTTGVVGQVVTITVDYENFPVGVEVEVSPVGATLNGEDLQDEDADVDLEAFPPTLTFTPHVAGTFVFEFSAEGGDAVAVGSATIVVTDGPLPPTEPVAIKSLKISGTTATLTTEPEATAVYGTTDLGVAPAAWPQVEATIDGTTVTVPLADSWRFLRAE